jgi:hypothetical protein
MYSVSFSQSGGRDSQRYIGKGSLTIRTEVPITVHQGYIHSIVEDFSQVRGVVSHWVSRQAKERLGEQVVASGIVEWHSEFLLDPRLVEETRFVFIWKGCRLLFGDIKLIILIIMPLSVSVFCFHSPH